ncbi:hypothetical protein KKH23_06680 [Patescibacteria group bacterium]|nr:hypothetical protein [Patescibacteria group bacterium]MBU0846861.1 hypothetical protein [Patescibacteria group bacterium]
MTKQTYSESLEEILNKLGEATIAPKGGAALFARLDGVDGRLGEVVELLKQMNGYTRKHSQLLAAHSQWIESHQLAHNGLDKQIDRLSLKANVIAGITGTMSLIAGILGISPNR